MPGSLEKLERGATIGGERLSQREYSHLRHKREREAKNGIDPTLLARLAQCNDIVHGWDDRTPGGFDWWVDAFSNLAPPPEMTVDQWADEFRKIPPEFAAEPGDWTTYRVPYMRAVMRACSPSHPCRRVVLVKPTQSGGTEAAVLNTIGHTIDINPRSMLIIFPTIELAESFSKERLEPMIEMMPRLKEKVATLNRSERGTAKKKRYPGGFLNMAGANSTAGLSSRPVPLVIMDEADECARAAGSTGNPTQLLSARTTTFYDKKEFSISSPSNDVDETGILQMWEDSSQGWLETQCPNADCGHWQVLHFDRMELDGATLACEKCGGYFAQWQWNRAGGEFERWRFDNPNHASTMGFRLSGLNSPWVNWQIDLVDDFKEATRLARLGTQFAAVFHNTKLARAYRTGGRRVEVDLYRERREVYQCHQAGAEIPAGVLLLTAAVDVMDSYLSYEVVGWGKFKESWGIEAGDIRGDPRAPGGEVWEALDKFIYNRLFRYEDGRCVRARLVFIDSGGHCTSEVYRYCRGRQPRCFAIKGVGGTGKPIIIGGRSRERSEGAWLLRLGVDTLKDEAHSRLAVAEPGPGFCHWPRLENGGDVAGYTQSYFDQLVAEERTLKYSAGGFARFTWAKARSAQNEAFDTRCYNRAALEYLKARLEQMPRDTLANLAPDAIEEIELGFGRRITNLKAGAKRSYTGRPSAGPTTTDVDTEAPQQQTGAQPKPRPDWAPSGPQTARYGASGSSF